MLLDIRTPIHQDSVENTGQRLKIEHACDPRVESQRVRLAVSESKPEGASYGFIPQGGSQYQEAVYPWVQPMSLHLAKLRAASTGAEEAPAGSCRASHHLIATLVALGQPLDAVLMEAEDALTRVLTMNDPDTADMIRSQQQCIRALQGNIHDDNATFTGRIQSSPNALLKFSYQSGRLQAAFLLDRPEEALAAADEARVWHESAQGHLMQFEYAFYHALTLARASTNASSPRKELWLQELLRYRNGFGLWAADCAEYSAQKHQLIQAEIFRLLGDELAAMKSYEMALQSARDHHLLPDEALAYELAAQHYKNTGFTSFAAQYGYEARRCYEAWGASAKVRLLDRTKEPALRERPAAQGDNDLIALLHATQSISREIFSNPLTKTLIRLLVEAVGAERGLLLLARHGEIFVEAEAQIIGETWDVALLPSIPIQDYPRAPRSLLNSVQRQPQKVVIRRARESHAFTADVYLQTQKPDSLLCVPILRNHQLIGMIYLENIEAAANFTDDKLMALEILASQAAISLENAQLYADLRREEEKLRTTIEGMADGLIVADTKAGISLINQAALRMVGLARNEDSILRDRQGMARCLQYRDADDVPVPFEQLPLTRALQGEIINQVEYRIRNLTTGRPLTIRLTASPLRNSAGTIQGAVVVFQDVTELTALDRLKDEFLRAMAHELKTPLLVASGYFEMYKLLRRKGVDAARLDDCLGRMESGLARLKTLMSTLVDVAVFQLRTIQLTIEEIDLRAMSRELGEGLAGASPKHKVRFTAGDAEPLCIQGDRARLNQVFTNFLQNAIKYSPEGGVITLDIQEYPDSVVVSIQDQGIGIPVERQARIFQRFYRAHAETEHDYGGMGVGLFISHEIVLAHQGHIWFCSEPGAGSVFSFRLPKLQEVIR